MTQKPSVLKALRVLDNDCRDSKKALLSSFKTLYKPLKLIFLNYSGKLKWCKSP
jgi:hypothetical protein